MYTYLCTAWSKVSIETEQVGLTSGICKPKAAQETSTEEHTLKKLLTKVMNSNEFCAY